MRISDWSSDVCSSDLLKNDDPADVAKHLEWHLQQAGCDLAAGPAPADVVVALRDRVQTLKDMAERAVVWYQPLAQYDDKAVAKHLKPESRAPLSDMRTRLAALAAWKVEDIDRSEEHTSELQSLMRISYAVLCLKKKTTIKTVKQVKI